MGLAQVHLVLFVSCVASHSPLWNCALRMWLVVSRQERHSIGIAASVCIDLMPTFFNASQLDDATLLFDLAPVTSDEEPSIGVKVIGE